jgi:hypothetical protein
MHWKEALQPTMLVSYLALKRQLRIFSNVDALIVDEPISRAFVLAVEPHAASNAVAATATVAERRREKRGERRMCSA